MTVCPEELVTQKCKQTCITMSVKVQLFFKFSPTVKGSVNDNRESSENT